MSDPMVFARAPRVRGPAARSTTWWGKAFVRSFEETVVDASELPRARALARSGRLGAMVVLAGMASAVVDPESADARMGQLRLTQLDDTAWAAFQAEFDREAGFLAALDAGELPAPLLEYADQVGVELLPGPTDFETACDCDAWMQPCLHALALLYQLSTHLDRDPWVLLLLRGRTREKLLEHLLGSDPELTDAGDRAAEILRLAGEAPAGPGRTGGLADTAVAAYDEAVSRLLGD